MAGVLPPPDLAALPVTAEDQVEIAVAIDVVRRAAGFDRQKIRFEDVPRPSGRSPAVPDERGCHLPEAENEVVDAIAVEIGDQRACLLSRRTGHWQFALRGRQVLPADA